MVHVKDEGSHFDAPIDMLWKFIADDSAHGESHSKTTRNHAVKPVNESTMLLTMEQLMNGQWVKVGNKITAMPPLAVAIEVVEGPLTGSKILNVYTPKGAKTGIDVYADFVSKQMPDSQLEHAARQNLETVFHEDTEALKAYMSRK